MANVYDVAAYILKKTGPITTMKLQKLVYYSQAWSLVWDEGPLFEEKIRAWAGGPVVHELFNHHQGQYTVSDERSGDPKKLSKAQRETIDGVLKFYGKKSGAWLSDLTHREAPWRNAREGLADGERGNAIITHASMAEYYSNLE